MVACFKTLYWQPPCRIGRFFMSANLKNHGMVVVAANHRLAKKRVVSLEDLRAEEVVGFKHQDAPGRYRNFLTACRDAGFSPRVTYVASIFPELCMAVKQRMKI